MARRSRFESGITVRELAARLAGEASGDTGTVIRGVAEIDMAGPADAVYAVDARRAELALASAAGVVLLPARLHIVSDRTCIRVQDAAVAAAAALEILYPWQAAAPGVHPSAIVGVEVTLGAGASIGPCAVLEDGASIGSGTEVGAGCVVGAGVSIGKDCLLYPRVTVYSGCSLGDRVQVHAGAVIGADGFGFARAGDTAVKIPQVGGVVIESDVEIGANACIDRGTLRPTRIGAGTKIDNLVQIGHNCQIGRNCAISGLTGVAGSTTFEDGVIVGGHAGLAGHQVIGAGSMLAAKSGVHGDLPPGTIVGGAPHMEIGVFRRVNAALPRLPDLLRRVRRLERRADGDDKE